MDSQIYLTELKSCPQLNRILYRINYLPTNPFTIWGEETEDYQLRILGDTIGYNHIRYTYEILHRLNLKFPPRLFVWRTLQIEHILFFAFFLPRFSLRHSKMWMKALYSIPGRPWGGFLKLPCRLLDGSVKVRHDCHIVVLNMIFDNSLPADAYHGEIQSIRIRWKPNAISRLPKDAENLQADPVALRAATEHVTYTCMNRGY